MEREKEILMNHLEMVIGKKQCGISCEKADIFKDSKGWHFRVEGFMAPIYLGETLAEAKAGLEKYASQAGKL